MFSILLAVAAGVPGQSGVAPATLVVSLPADARLFVDDRATTSTGSVRELATPSLSRGGNYTYTLRAQVVRDGQVVTQERTVRVSGGARRNVAFDFGNSGNAYPGENRFSGGSAPGNSGPPGGGGNAGAAGGFPGPSGNGGGTGIPSMPGGSPGFSGSGGGSSLPSTPGGSYIAQKLVNGQAYGQLSNGQWVPINNTQAGSPPRRPGNNSRPNANGSGGPKGSRPAGQGGANGFALNGPGGKITQTTTTVTENGRRYQLTYQKQNGQWVRTGKTPVPQKSYAGANTQAGRPQSNQGQSNRQPSGTAGARPGSVSRNTFSRVGPARSPGSRPGGNAGNSGYRPGGTASGFRPGGMAGGFRPGGTGGFRPAGGMGGGHRR